MPNKKPVSNLQNNAPAVEGSLLSAPNSYGDMDLLGSKHLQQVISKINSGDGIFVTKSLEELEQMAEG